MDVLSLNQRFVRELLELYKQLPAVWNLKCPEYKNKIAKGQAYDVLVKKCREYVPDADRDFVKNKINSLRTSFRKEHRKVLQSRAKAKDTREIYVPTLWYYNMLLFTAGQDDGNSQSDQNDSINFVDESESVSQDENSFFNFKSEPTSPNMELQNPDPLLTEDTFLPHQKRKSRIDPVIMKLPKITNVAAAEDVFDAIGKNVAHKLRGMTQQQRIIAEKIISDIMYHGQMETLTPDSHLSLKKRTPDT